MNGQEHLQWCKDRAISLVDAGSTAEAYASMASDMDNHEATANNPAILMGMSLMIGGHLNTADQMKTWINGF